MICETYDMPFIAENRKSVSAVINEKQEAFVRLCLQWDSAEELAFDLADVGYDVTPRTCRNWRNRSFKRVPYGAVQAVKYLAEYRLITKARARAERIREGLEAL